MQQRSYTQRPVRRPGFDLRRRGRGLGFGGQGFGAWLASVALLLQIVVPLGQAVPLPAGTDGLSRTLVVCTAYGPRTMTPDRQEAPGRTASPSGAAHQCPVCTALGFCGLASAVAVPLPAGLALPVRAETASHAFADRRPLARRARGPPLVA